MSSQFDRMIIRAQKDGKTSGEKHISRARKSFEYALNTSSEAETVKRGEDEFKALITREQPFGDGGDKRIISAMFETGLDTGQLIFVPSTGRHWLTFNPELRNKSYARMQCKEVNETITWRDRKNKVYQTLAVVGTLTGENTLSIADGDRFGYWSNSERVYCYIPKAPGTEFIEVDKNVVMNSETWKVLAKNSIQEEGLLALQLTKWKNDDMVEEIPPIEIIGQQNVKTAFGLVYDYEIIGAPEGFVVECTGIEDYVLNDNILTATFTDGQLGQASIKVLLDEAVLAEIRINLLPMFG